MKAQELALLVDQFDQVRSDRLDADKLSSTLKKQETQLKTQIIDHLQAEGVDVIGGTTLTVTLTRKSKPNAQDWGEIYGYILETREFDILHRRLTETAIKARWEDGLNIPGVTEIEVLDLSLSHVRRG